MSPHLSSLRTYQNHDFVLFTEIVIFVEIMVLGRPHKKCGVCAFGAFLEEKNNNSLKIKCWFPVRS